MRGGLSTLQAWTQQLVGILYVVVQITRNTK